MKNKPNIDQFDYPLPEERIARYPLARREGSKLLVFNHGAIEDRRFFDLFDCLPPDTLLVCNNTKVVRARLIFHKPTGARIEVFCLEPYEPASFERALAAKGSTVWHCMIGGAKKFKEPVSLADGRLTAERLDGDLVRFTWSEALSFGELLEALGRTPIPPYLNRESEAIDTTRYQTTYASIEGSVAAPTAGLHFSQEMTARWPRWARVTLHVGAGTFLPVKESDVSKHVMHTEHFSVLRSELEQIVAAKTVVAVGTTSVRTLESLAQIGGRIAATGCPDLGAAVGQWEDYEEKSLEPLLDYMTVHGLEKIEGSTQIMITPGFRFAVVDGLVTNFHQPRSTLLLLISAVVGEDWRRIYTHALQGDYRFLSYGDSSLLWLSK